MASAAITGVMVLSVIAVLVIVLALVLYVRKLRAYQDAAEPDGSDAALAQAPRGRAGGARTRSRR